MCDCAGTQYREWPTCGGVTPGSLIRRVQALEDLTRRMSATNRNQALAIKDLQRRVTALENGGGGSTTPVTVWAADWNGTGYTVPATAPQESIVLRIFTGPEPYDGPTWDGVRDLFYVTVEEA